MAKFWLFFCTQVQGRIQGRGKGHVPHKARSIFCTNIILHRRVLFYKFADITVMFLSQDSLYCFAMHLMRQQNAICCPNDDDQWSAGGVHPSASPSQLHSMQNRLLLWTISLTLEPADWFCKNWLETKWWVDEMMIIWYCHTISICKDSFFSLRKCFFSLMTQNSSGFWGFAPRPPPGLCPWTPLGDFRLQTPCQCPSQTKILDPPLQGYWMKVGYEKNCDFRPFFNFRVTS